MSLLPAQALGHSEGAALLLGTHARNPGHHPEGKTWATCFSILITGQLTEEAVKGTWRQKTAGWRPRLLPQIPHLKMPPFPTAQQMTLKPLLLYRSGVSEKASADTKLTSSNPTRGLRLASSGRVGVRAAGAPTRHSPCDCIDGRHLLIQPGPAQRNGRVQARKPDGHTRAGGCVKGHTVARGHTVRREGGGGAGGKGAELLGEAGPHFLSRCLNLGSQLHPEHKERLFSNKNILLAPGENGKF